MYNSCYDTLYRRRFKSPQIREIICETIFAYYLKTVVIDSIFYCFV